MCVCMHTWVFACSVCDVSVVELYTCVLSSIHKSLFASECSCFVFSHKHCCTGSVNSHWGIVVTCCV